ncbi:MAG: hypothetical protein ACLFMT_07255 [Halobacteriales archaeon]
MSGSTRQAGEKGDVDADREWYFELSRPILKFVVAVAVLVSLWWLVENVGAASEIDVPLPATSETITLAGVLSSALTVFLMIAIVAFSASFGRILHDGTGVSVLESLSKLGGLAVSLVFAYWMFGWVVETFPEYAAEYDVAFLVLGIVVVGWLGLVLYSNVDEIVESIG